MTIRETIEATLPDTSSMSDGMKNVVEQALGILTRKIDVDTPEKDVKFLTDAVYCFGVSCYQNRVDRLFVAMNNFADNLITEKQSVAQAMESLRDVKNASGQDVQAAVIESMNNKTVEEDSRTTWGDIVGKTGIPERGSGFGNEKA